MTRCFSAMQVNITRCLHELAKETDRIAEIGSSDREVDDVGDEQGACLIIMETLDCS